CTDLVATVTFPLRALYDGSFTVAPVSVLVDPIRALRVFGLEKGGSFTEKIIYIYNKQVEEADIIVISKCDLLDPQRLERLRRVIAERFPSKTILAVSSRTGANLTEWFSQITHDKQVAGTAMEVDYQVYADGEALLGWLNCTAQVSHPRGLDSEKFLQWLATRI